MNACASTYKSCAWHHCHERACQYWSRACQSVRGCRRVWLQRARLHRARMCHAWLHHARPRHAMKCMAEVRVAALHVAALHVAALRRAALCSAAPCMATPRLIGCSMPGWAGRVCPVGSALGCTALGRVLHARQYGACLHSCVQWCRFVRRPWVGCRSTPGTRRVSMVSAVHAARLCRAWLRCTWLQWPHCAW